MVTLAYAPSVVISFWMLEAVLSSDKMETNWLQKFIVDIAIDVPFLTTSAPSAVACGHVCLESPACRSFAYATAQSNCWLYDHLVLYATNGTAAPGTRYFWRLSPRCPTELGYSLVDDVCFRITTTWETCDRAREICEREGAMLFVVDSQAKLLILRTRSTDVTWVGAFRDQVTDDWFHVDGSRLPTDADVWQVGEPNNAEGTQNAGRLSEHGTLDDFNCDGLSHTACQVPLP